MLATTIARQIKQDYPDSVLTWAIGSCCKQVILNNPYVDKIWEIPLADTKKEVGEEDLHELAKITVSA